MDSNISPAIIAFLGVIIGVLLQYFTSKWRADEDRAEDFKFKLKELRINAAQTAYKYIYQVYRTYARNLENTSRADKLAKEARDWLDGQILILGEDIHKAVFTYLNAAGDRDRLTYNLMNEAQKKLKSVLKKDFINKI